MRKTKTGKLVAAVMSALPPRSCGSVPWFNRIGAADLAQIETIRASWRLGKIATTQDKAPISRTMLSRVIADQLEKAGVITVSSKRVSEWLKK